MLLGQLLVILMGWLVLFAVTVLVVWTVRARDLVEVVPRQGEVIARFLQVISDLPGGATFMQLAYWPAMGIILLLWPIFLRAWLMALGDVLEDMRHED